MRHITDEERRARLARRHGFTERLPDVASATRAMTVLHATEPASVYLSLWARVDGLKVGDVDKELYDVRTVVKQLAMRRTLFVFPRDLLPAAWGSASARVAAVQERRLVGEIEKQGIAADGAAWLTTARRAVMEMLSDGVPRSAARIREEVPELAGRLDLAPGTKYAANVSVAPRVLTQLGLEAQVVRGPNEGHWRLSRPQWTRMVDWLGAEPVPLPEREGYAELVRRWLRSFGPGTEADIVWWLGATKSAVRRALADVEAVAVTLDGGGPGWVLPDDLDPEPPVGPWAALLPVLDPTVMGWKERGFYLGPHAPVLFDSNGNAGTTAWWDGRIVGCWVQDGEGRVRLRLVEPVPAAGRRALAAAAERLTDWLDGQRVATVYAAPAMKPDFEGVQP